MRSFRVVAATVVACFVSFLLAEEPAAPAAGGPSPSQAKETLEKLGLRVSASGVVMPVEQEFYKSMSELEVVRKKYLAAEKEHVLVDGETVKIEKAITQLKAQHVQMNATMAGGRLPAAEHNRMVGMINATGGQISLLIDQLEKAQDKVKAARGKAGEAREAYITKILAAQCGRQGWDRLG